MEEQQPPAAGGPDPAAQRASPPAPVPPGGPTPPESSPDASPAHAAPEFAPPSFETPPSGAAHAVAPAALASAAASADPSYATAPTGYAPVLASAPDDARPRRSRGAVVAVWILAVVLVLALGAGAWLAYEYIQAQQEIAEQRDRISEQEGEIEEQRELIDEKESFGAAMTALMTTTEKFDGVLTASVVPWESYERLAERAWAHRWDATKLAADTGQAQIETEQLEQLWSTAQEELTSNATGTTYEAVIDRLGGGFVRTVLDDEQCGLTDEGILGCVYEHEPYLVHFDAAENTQPFMTDEIRTGIAYHEFAHVLQFTNPGPTEEALNAFDGDFEVMADCFTLTYLDGWTLDHRVWTSAYEYWDVNIGYGVTCTEPQRQAVRDWYGELGVTLRTVGAED